MCLWINQSSNTQCTTTISSSKSKNDLPTPTNRALTKEPSSNLPNCYFGVNTSHHQLIYLFDMGNLLRPVISARWFVAQDNLASHPWKVLAEGQTLSKNTWQVIGPSVYYRLLQANGLRAVESLAFCLSVHVNKLEHVYFFSETRRLWADTDPCTLFFLSFPPVNSFSLLLSPQICEISWYHKSSNLRR